MIEPDAEDAHQDGHDEAGQGVCGHDLTNDADGETERHADIDEEEYEDYLRRLDHESRQSQGGHDESRIRFGFNSQLGFFHQYLHLMHEWLWELRKVLLFD